MNKVIALIAGILLFGSLRSADVPISGLPAATALGGSEVMPCVQSATTKKCSATQLNTFIDAGLALTGDLTSSGLVTTLATVNSNVGSFTSANVTVNAKGLVTAASNGSGGPVAANPSATIGLSAVNGVASTFMASDSAPPLSQAIVPTWSAIHTWSLAEPRLLLNESDQGSNLKLWDFDLNGGVLTGRTRTDVDGAGVNWIAVTRGTTTAISSINIGNATNNQVGQWLGTGRFTFNGGVTAGTDMTAARFVPTASTVPANGMYMAGTNIVGIAANSALGLQVETTQSVGLKAGLISEGTKFAASGCSNSATVGGAIAGQFTSGTTGTCTVVITLPTAPNGWACNVHDITTPANVIGQSATGVTSCTVSGTTVSGDVVVFSAMAY